MMVLERRGVIVMFKMAIVVKNPAASWVEMEHFWPCTD